jgi:NTP pyrophosphatase (non-canonical NTP hydrolase)
MIDNDVYRNAIQTFGLDNQLFMLVEECAELQKEASKLFRRTGNKDRLAEEIADVEIMIQQMKLAYGIHTKVERIKEVKILRLREKIEYVEETKNETHRLQP